MADVATKFLPDFPVVYPRTQSFSCIMKLGNGISGSGRDVTELVAMCGA